MPFLVLGAGLVVGALLAVATAGPSLQRKLPGWTSIADAVNHRPGGFGSKDDSKEGGGGGAGGELKQGGNDLGSIISNFVNAPASAARAIAISAIGYSPEPSPASTAPGQPMTLLAGVGAPAWGPSPVNIPAGGYIAPIAAAPVGNVLPIA